MNKSYRYLKIIKALSLHYGMSDKELIEVLKNKESKYILLLLLKKYKCVKDDEIMQVLNYKNKRSIAYNTKRAEEKLLINREFREKFFELEENLLK